MPFAKRVVEPQLLCRHRVPNSDGLLFEDLPGISHECLSRTLRQLSDLAKHACSVFQELEGDLASTSLRVRGLHRRIGRLQETCAGLDPKQEPVPVSNLDVESKLTTHHRAPWPQQRNVLHSSTRPPCVDELHRRAQLSVWMLHRDQQRGRSSSSSRVTISLYPAPLPPAPPPPPHLRATFESTRSSSSSSSSSSPTECCRLSPWSRKATPSDPDQVTLGQRSKFPVPNSPSTLDKQTNWTRTLPLPTPEERMRRQVMTSSVVPINVTGLVFDRDASVRCSLVHSQSLLQRRKKLRRRRTVIGVCRQVREGLDSDESPVSTQRTAVVLSSPDVSPSHGELSSSHFSTRDSGCQTEDFLVSGGPSRRRTRTQRVQASLSRSAGNISSPSDHPGSDAAFSPLRCRSLPRDGIRSTDRGRRHSEEDEEEEELCPFDTEDFLSAPLLLKDEEGVDEQAGGHRYQQLSEDMWTERTRSRLLPRSEISSSSDTFGSPVHSVSVSAAAAALAAHMDHKDDHQSSSGNWSGSSSACPSQTSETLPPAALTPPLTGSSHCDSELSLNAAAAEDHHHRSGSFSSAAMDILEEAGVSPPLERGWNCGHAEPPLPSLPPPPPPRPRDFSPEPSLGCPSFSSMNTCESSFSEKADAVSGYSVDTEGYYTSMHFDCGLKESGSFTCAGHMTLRKPKAKPPPPQRSSSLRKICSDDHEEEEEEEPKISCGQQRPPSKLRLVLSGSSPSSVEDVAELCRFSSADVLSHKDEGVAFKDEGAAFKDEGAAFRDEGVVYADLWMPCELKPGDPYRSLSNSSTATATTVVECARSRDGSESAPSRSASRAATPSLLPPAEGDSSGLTSPETLGGVASPSSGYSSQCDTPTSSSCFGSAFFPAPPPPPSPAGRKRKPKVPERKSSLSSPSLHAHVTAATERDPEPPATAPPSHLHLHWVDKVSDLGTFSSAPATTVTPTALRSVQLRSVEDKASKRLTPLLHCASSLETLASTEGGGVLESAPAALELRSAPPPPLQDVCDATAGQEEDVWTETCEDLEASLSDGVETPAAADGQSEETHLSKGRYHDDDRDDECESSGVSAESSSKDEKDEKDESTLETEEDSVPGETAASPPSDADNAVFLSPGRSRTTEDLFAMIHRSKRKVLGRKDSAEVAARNRLNVASPASSPSSGDASAPSSPVSSAASPASAAVTPPGLQRVSGSIYRNAKKSITSSEEFKLLLLRKGSRCDSSYRMSATEILKSPVTPKSLADSLTESPRQHEDHAAAAAASPSPSDQLFFSRANADAFSPKSFPSSAAAAAAAARHGRSRIPPPANSSRYGARSRLCSAPMQAISEGETENSDGSPHGERTPPRRST